MKRYVQRARVDSVVFVYSSSDSLSVVAVSRVPPSATTQGARDFCIPSGSGLPRFDEVVKEGST